VQQNHRISIRMMCSNTPRPKHRAVCRFDLHVAKDSIVLFRQSGGSFAVLPRQRQMRHMQSCLNRENSTRRADQ
jgi:hypothetical protein